MTTTITHNDLLGHPINPGDLVMLLGDPNRRVLFTTVVKLNPKKVRILARTWGGDVKEKDVYPDRILVIHDEFLESILSLRLQNKLPMA